MRLLTDIAPRKQFADAGYDLPDEINMGITIAQHRMADAKAYQAASRLNYQAARDNWEKRKSDMPATRRIASAQAAYARFLMNIDQDFLEHGYQIPIRPEYFFPEAGLGLEPRDVDWLPLPAPDGAAPAYLHDHAV